MSDVMQIMFNSKIFKFDKVCTVENVGRDGTRLVRSGTFFHSEE